MRAAALRRSWLRGIAAGVACVAIAAATTGCGPASSPGTSGAAPTTGPTGAPTGQHSATNPPAVAQRFVFGEDVVVSTELAGTDDLYVNPGAVIEADDVLHMFPNLFSRWPGRVRVPHLTSEDGLAWTLDDDTSPLDSDDVALANPGIDVSTGFVGDDGTWVLIFETVSTSTPWKLGRATAPGPRGPWAVEEAPILTPGSSGAFDAGGVRWPSAVKVGDRWALYYAGFDVVEGGTGSIGVAFWNGSTWDKQPEPVLQATEAWEGRSLDRPRVAATPNGLVMVYAGRDLTDRGLATSLDGLTWTKLPGPSIEQSDFPDPAKRAWDAALLYREQQLEYFLEIGFETTNVYRATLDWP